MDPDGSRYLLGDTLGNLHMLVLSHDSQRVVGLKLEALGRISAPSTISYLDSGVVFVVCCGLWPMKHAVTAGISSQEDAASTGHSVMPMK